MSIQIQKVTDASFKKYGRVLTGEYDVDALIEKMQENIIALPKSMSQLQI